MYSSEDLTVWNLTDGGAVRAGAVEIFNVVGRLSRPEHVDVLRYRLNGLDWRPVYFSTRRRDGRLWYAGAFNIDTIRESELGDHNKLVLSVVGRDGAQRDHEIAFRRIWFESGEPRFTLNLEGVGATEEVGQVVEGGWRLGVDPAGRRCLEIPEDNLGYDRIILFGRKEWTTGYEVYAKLAVQRIEGSHNIGLVFKWNPHERGDGTHLPTKWSTGLGYYCSYAPHRGLCVRFGVKVHVDEEGKKQGDFPLGRAPYDLPARWTGKLLYALGLTSAASELKTGRDYAYRLRVTPERYSLTLWEAERQEPAPQVVVDNPRELLARGPVGILAYKAALRLFELRVRPI